MRILITATARRRDRAPTARAAVTGSGGHRQGRIPPFTPVSLPPLKGTEIVQADPNRVVLTARGPVPEGCPSLTWSADDALTVMDDNEIAAGIVSVSTPAYTSATTPRPRAWLGRIHAAPNLPEAAMIQPMSRRVPRPGRVRGTQTAFLNGIEQSGEGEPARCEAH